MAEKTTISVDTETKTILDGLKREDETWDQFLLRYEAEHGMDGRSAEQLLEQTRRLEQEIQELPSRVADGVEERMRR